MRVIVQSRGGRMWLPVPLPLASAAVLLMPEATFAEMRKSLPPPCRQVITKDFLRKFVKECISVLKPYRGLEIIHVEAQDGTMVSIRI